MTRTPLIVYKPYRFQGKRPMYLHNYIPALVAIVLSTGFTCVMLLLAIGIGLLPLVAIKLWKAAKDKRHDGEEEKKRTISSVRKT